LPSPALSRQRRGTYFFLSLDGRVSSFSPLPRRERTKVRVKEKVKVKTPHSNSLPQGERGFPPTCPLPPAERDKKVALSRKGKEGSAVPRCESLSLLSSPSTGGFLPFPLSLDGRVSSFSPLPRRERTKVRVTPPNKRRDKVANVLPALLCPIFVTHLSERTQMQPDRI